MIHTTEARWFIRGKLPAGINDWCNDNQSGLIRQEPRTDYYLTGFKNSDIGVKYREEKLEFKQAVQDKKKLLIIKSFTGILQEWKKWSFDLSETSLFESMLNDNKLIWKGVHKERWLKFFVNDNGILRSVSFSTDIKCGCQFEIGVVSNIDKSKTWWTIGFEAFGEKPEALVRRVAEKIFSQHRFFENLNMNSMSYPEWIKVL